MNPQRARLRVGDVIEALTASIGTATSFYEWRIPKTAARITVESANFGVIVEVVGHEGHKVATFCVLETVEDLSGRIVRGSWPRHMPILPLEVIVSVAFESTRAKP